MHCWCLVLLPLFFQTPALAVVSAAPNSGSAVYPLLLSSGYYRYIPVIAFANTTIIQYAVESNTSVSTALMTYPQFQDFNQSGGSISNSLVYQNATASNRNVPVGPGSYEVLVYAGGGNANATLVLSVFPNNPLADGPLVSPEPSGISSYGLTNSSGVDTPYRIASTDVVGVASISTMDAFNGTAGSVGTNPSGATVQLNSVLVVDERGGTSQVYWCQNTPDFVTATRQFSLADNVWNYSASGVLSNESVTSEGGGGYVSTFNQDGVTEYYYAFGETNSSYVLPMGMVLLMNVTSFPGSGVLVQFGASVTGIVLGGKSSTDWFDNVTIRDPGVTNSYFLTDGNSSTPLNTFYNSELVFAGEGNGESTNFTHLSGSLGLFYANGTSGLLSTFPSYFSFGRDTAESADNLRIQYLSEGEVRVGVGVPNYEFLGPASGAFPLWTVETTLGFPAMSNGNTSSTVSAETPVQTGTSSGQPGVPAFPPQVLWATALTLAVLGSYLLARRLAHGELRSK